MSSNAVVFICALLVSVVLCYQNKLNLILFSGNFEFIDLTHSFDNDTIYWPGVQNFKFTKKVAHLQDNDTWWYAANEFMAGEHGGTHIDAPYHFAPGGLFAGSIPLDNLIVPLIIVDISQRVNNDPNFVLYKHDMDYMLNNNFGKPCLLIFKFGWTKYFHDPRDYLGVDSTGNNLNFPGLSQEVAEWITSYKNIVGVGVDTASVDPGASQDYPAHRVLLGAGLYALENVKLDRYVPEYGCAAVALPMKIAEGTGAPLRLVAICPKHPRPK